jgi:hypothetical protein
MIVNIITARLTHSVEITTGEERRWKERDNKMIKREIKTTEKRSKMEM